jgi:hypothetical protein
VQRENSYFFRMSIFTPLAIVLISKLSAVSADGECFADEGLNTFFGTPAEGSCCQNHVCLLPCPEEVDEPSKGESREVRYLC